jgi:hypothetical protein
MTNQATPSLLELLLRECLIGLVFILTLSHFESYTQAIGTSFDNAGYISIARDIRSGHLSDLTPKLFGGTSYAIAAVSTVFRVPEDVALLAISVLCSGGAIWLVFRIWGAWIAAFFLC